MQDNQVDAFHVAVIMDGNGRWAEARGLNRVAGHARGARRVSELVEACPGLGVTHLTLYAFSTENWRRPLAEVDGIMRIFRTYIINRMDDLHAHDVRVRFLGMRHRVPAHLRQLMTILEDKTRACQGLNLSIAIDYGGRDELTRAVRAISGEVERGAFGPGAISETLISGALDTRDLPDPDFIIRTSGECRISNFLLWQSAYAEYDFRKTAWPDFTVSEFADSIRSFRERDRRFGAIDPAKTRTRAKP